MIKRGSKIRVVKMDPAGGMDWQAKQALKRAKKAGKRPGYWYGGIVLKSGKKGFAIYREGKVVEQYSVIGR